MDVLLSAEQIQKRVGELARQIAADYRDQPLTIVGVLTGSLVFLADLVRRLPVPLRIGLIQASSYHGPATTPGELRVGPDLVPDVRGRGRMTSETPEAIHKVQTKPVRVAGLHTPTSTGPSLFTV